MQASTVINTWVTLHDIPQDTKKDTG